MKYLLDTHTLIWTLLEPQKLSVQSFNTIADKTNQIYVSSVNFWEICIKIGCGKLALGSLRPERLPAVCKDWGFQMLVLTPGQASTFSHLTAHYHNDPFDRMLIWQAIRKDLIFITDDRNIRKYTSEGLQVIW
ncbi:twitching motility protein PilT [Dyadobacter beijingensis]|uniref:Twitching motility protein PilT n=1 Tax=Dyadobacter beijingensis TaxID=365489 RepID=A0ABQ2IE51_9BACT|nr:type II toxin-antitoxin system VapC family toxin [Dyadobacter beijingensis]GGN05134.1 twitching motility protein PilT [Dyadobacter beijingensis]